jgi:NAD(P)-dependent dehydrogenase (short-subunit alcohol dehydrogenase family)
MTRVAVVTGAAGGVGAATCDVLEQQGWSVVRLDRHPIDSESAIQVDLADAEAVQTAISVLPRIDALVNNAAIQLFKPLHETTTDEWDEVSRVNLRGPFACIKAAWDQLIESRGAVVNVASVHALGTSHSISAYASSKGGLMAFTRAAALELAAHDVRVNAVLPGAVETPALRAGLNRVPDGERTLVARTPLKRIGDPHEIGEAIAFLADNERSAFITGQSLVVDGGALARLGTE